MKKETTPTYILTLLLKTQIDEENIINKRLGIARNISNSLTGVVLRRYNLMLERKEYRKIKKQLNPINKKYHVFVDKKHNKELNSQRKELYSQLDTLYLKCGMSQYSLYKDVKQMYKHFKNNIGSLESQAIADRVWSKFNKLLKGTAN